MSKDKLDFMQKTEVVLPVIERTFPISFSEWKRLMDRIKNCGDSSHKYESLGWTCIGICGSAILVAVTFPFSVDFVKTISATSTQAASTQANLAATVTESAVVCIAIASAILAYFSFGFAKQHATDRSDIRRIIVEDMQAHSDKHPVLVVDAKVEEISVGKTL